MNDQFTKLNPELQEKLVLWMAKIQARLRAEQSQSKKGA